MNKISKIFYYISKYTFLTLDAFYIFLSEFRYKISHNVADENYKSFWTNGFLKFNCNDKELLKQLSISVQSLSTDKFVKPNNLLQETFLKKIFSNTKTTLYEDRIFSEYSFVKDPLYLFPKLEKIITDEIIPFSEKIMRSKVSIENVQIYKVDAKTGDLTNGVFHVDRDIKKAFKLMIYLTDCYEYNGPFIIKNNDNNEFVWTGKVGDGLAFAHSNFIHKGSKPTKGYRWAINLKIFPNIFNSKIEYKGSRYLNADRRKLLFKRM
jgi:hypothetical protein